MSRSFFSAAFFTSPFVMLSFFISPAMGSVIFIGFAAFAGGGAGASDFGGVSDFGGASSAKTGMTRPRQAIATAASVRTTPRSRLMLTLLGIRSLSGHHTASQAGFATSLSQQNLLGGLQ